MKKMNQKYMASAVAVVLAATSVMSVSAVGVSAADKDLEKVTFLTGHRTPTIQDFMQLLQTDIMKRQVWMWKSFSRRKTVQL